MEKAVELVTHTYQEYVDTATTLIEICFTHSITRDVAVVQEILDVTEKRWNMIKGLARKRKQQIDEAQMLEKKFQNMISPLEDKVSNCRKCYEKPRDLGSETEKLEEYSRKLLVRTSLTIANINLLSGIKI